MKMAGGFSVGDWIECDGRRARIVSAVNSHTLIVCYEGPWMKVRYVWAVLKAWARGDYK